MVEVSPSSPSSATNRKRASSAPDISIDQVAVTSPASATPSNGSGAGGVAFSPSTNLPPAGSSPASRNPSSPGLVPTAGGAGGPRTPGLDSPTPGSSDGVSHGAMPSVLTQSLPAKLDTAPEGGMGKKSTSQRQFDLCTTLYKRRGGFGRNAENNWCVHM